MGLRERVLSRQQELGLSQKELVERSGLKQAALSHIKTGRTSELKADTLFKLADALQCDARWLATGNK